jgi:hypothetical protein
VRAESTHLIDVEKQMMVGRESVSKRMEELEKRVMSEIGMVKKRHTRLLSLYRDGLEGTIEKQG